MKKIILISFACLLAIVGCKKDPWDVVEKGEWNNDRMILDIREGRLSVTAEVWEKRMPDGGTFGEHLMRQRKVLIKKVNTTKNQYISKPEMKSILGGRRSPDEMDMLMMSRIFTIYKPKGNYQGLNLLRL